MKVTMELTYERNGEGMRETVGKEMIKGKQKAGEELRHERNHS
jgi:hypothetical protein